MIKDLLTGVWWFDALAVLGFFVLTLLFLGIPVWMFGSKLRWRRKDAAEMARLLDLASQTTDIPKHRQEAAK